MSPPQRTSMSGGQQEFPLPAESPRGGFANQIFVPNPVDAVPEGAEGSNYPAALAAPEGAETVVATIAEILGPNYPAALAALAAPAANEAQLINTVFGIATGKTGQAGQSTGKMNLKVLGKIARAGTQSGKMTLLAEEQNHIIKVLGRRIDAERNKSFLNSAAAARHFGLQKAQVNAALRGPVHTVGGTHQFKYSRPARYSVAPEAVRIALDNPYKYKVGDFQKTSFNAQMKARPQNNALRAYHEAQHAAGKRGHRLMEALQKGARNLSNPQILGREN